MTGRRGQRQIAVHRCADKASLLYLDWPDRLHLLQLAKLSLKGYLELDQLMQDRRAALDSSRAWPRTLSLSLARDLAIRLPTRFGLIFIWQAS